MSYYYNSCVEPKFQKKKTILIQVSKIFWHVTLVVDLLQNDNKMVCWSHSQRSWSSCVLRFDAQKYKEQVKNYNDSRKQKGKKVRNLDLLRWIISKPLKFVFCLKPLVWIIRSFLFIYSYWLFFSLSFSLGYQPRWHLWRFFDLFCPSSYEEKGVAYDNLIKINRLLDHTRGKVSIFNR